METIGQYLLTQKKTYVVKQKFDRKNYINKTGMKEIDNNNTIDKIKTLIQTFYGTNFDQINTKHRNREKTDLRAVFCYFARQYTTLSFDAIGKHFTNFEHWKYTKQNGKYYKYLSIGLAHPDVMFHCRNYVKNYNQVRFLKKNHELMINQLTTK